MVKFIKYNFWIILTFITYWMDGPPILYLVYIIIGFMIPSKTENEEKNTEN